VHIGQRIYPFKYVTGQVARVEEPTKQILLQQIKRESKIVKEELNKLIKSNTLLQSYFLGFKDLGISTLIKRFT
jgi:hypothetical protein